HHSENRGQRHQPEGAARNDDRQRRSFPLRACIVVDRPSSACTRRAIGSIKRQSRNQMKLAQKSCQINTAAHSATSLTPAGFNSERNFAVASRLNCLSEASIQRKKRFRLASANRGLLNSE